MQIHTTLYRTDKYGSVRIWIIRRARNGYTTESVRQRSLKFTLSEFIVTRKSGRSMKQQIELVMNRKIREMKRKGYDEQLTISQRE